MIAWLWTLPPLYAVLTSADRGLDAMDESHYLLAAQPRAQGKAFNSIFGWYGGPLWQLSGQHLGRFRILGAMLLVGAALVLAAAVARAGRLLAGTDWPAWLRWSWPAAAVSAALAYYTVFVRTPSYNWFAAVGLMLLAAGLVRLMLVLSGLPEPSGRRPALCAGTLCALGGFVTAIGKATTALAAVTVLLVVVAVLTVGYGRAAWRRLAHAALAAAITSIALVGLHVAFVRSAAQTVAALRRSAGMMAAVDPGAYGTGALPVAQRGLYNEIVGRPAGWLLGVAGLSVLAVVVLRRPAAVAAKPARKPHQKQSTDAAAGLIVLAGGYAVLAAAVTFTMIARYPGGVPGLAMSTVPFVVMAEAALVIAVARALFDGNDQGGRTRVALFAAGALATMAVCYPLGTNVEYATQLPGGVVLLVAATVLALSTLGGRAGQVALAASLVCVLSAGVFMVPLTRLQAPYRIVPLSQQNQARQIVPGAATVMVDQQSADWIDQLRVGAASGGWAAGTPLFDLTWHPAATVVLDAEPPNVLLPALPGWPDPGGSAAFAARQEDPARWRSAWLLVPHGQDDRLTDVATKVWGRRFPADYVLVSLVTAPFDHQEQGLWRPRP